MAKGESPPMTRGGAITMSKQNVEKFPLQIPPSPRPSLITQQSSSLPSTPYQRARKLSDECRILSPVKGTETSPSRSAHSESDSTLRPAEKNTWNLTGCKYETGMAYSRRRIPYSVGGDKLQRAPTIPRKFLEPKIEQKLSGDMQELYGRLLPSKESEDRRARFVLKLDTLLNKEWPGSNIKVNVFGSSGNMLFTSDSDVDICITTSMKALERVCLLANALAEHGMERVVCVPHAKVPIVKIWDPELQLACDLNVNNTLALENTRMIKTYVEIDDRVRPLAMIIKDWTRKRILNDAALGGTLSSYTWICMILNFLQTRNPPILPALHRRPHQCTVDSNGKQSAFADNIHSLRGFGKENRESIGELLFHFFRRYGHEIDYDHNVISIREGSLISKQAKTWHLMQNNRLCVEEPFNTERNLGNTADDISFRGVHLELRRACDLISECRLEEALEQYEFPPTAQTTWAKPPPQPRPVLSRSASQSSRAGKIGSNNHRGPRQGQGQSRSGPSNRRNSSAAALNKLTSAQDSGVNVSRNALPTPPVLPNFHIQDQLYTQYQYLQQQEATLRLHLHQRTVQAQQLQSQVSGQTIPSGTVGPTYAPIQAVNTRRQTSHDAAPLSAPLRQQFFFQQPMSVNPSRAPKYPSNMSVPSQQSVHTNPSSPSMSPAQPIHANNPELRRGVHRSSAAEASLAAIRSQSQPPTSRAFHNEFHITETPPPMPLSTRSFLAEIHAKEPPPPLGPGFRNYAIPPRQYPKSRANPAFQGACLGMESLDQLPQFLQRAGIKYSPEGNQLPPHLRIGAPEMQHFNTRIAAQPAVNAPYTSPRMNPSADDSVAADAPSTSPSMNSSTDDSVAANAPYTLLRMSPPTDDPLTAKEYVGYYLHDSPPTHPYPRLTPLANIPSYNDLVQRARGMSPDVTRLKHPSRSPSPSSSSSRRERSVSFYSATSHVSSSHLASAPPGPPTTTRRSGPIIANGSDVSMSDYATPPECQSLYFPAEVSEAASLSDEPMDTPVTDSVTPSQELQDSFSLDAAVDVERTNSLPTMLQFGEFPARSTYRPSFGTRPEDSTYADMPIPRVPPVYQNGVDENSQGLGININTPNSTSVSPNGEQKSSSSIIYQANTAPKGDIGADLSKINIEKPLKPLPLLSPVREVRTPSPTTLRREEMKADNPNKAVYGRSISTTTASLLLHTASGKQQQAEQLTSKPNGSPKIAQGQNSGWQQQTSKKKRKNKKASNESGGVTQSTSGTMAGETERKGG